MTTTTPCLLSLRDAGCYLGVSVPTVRLLISSGRLAFVRSGPRGKLYVALAELESFVRRNTRAHDAREEVKK